MFCSIYKSWDDEIVSMMLELVLNMDGSFFFVLISSKAYYNKRHLLTARSMAYNLQLHGQGLNPSLLQDLGSSRFCMELEFKLLCHNGIANSHQIDTHSPYSHQFESEQRKHQQTCRTLGSILLE